MTHIKKSHVLLLLLIPAWVIAAEANAPISATGSIMKMMLGLGLVLGVMALVTWGLKRMLPGAGQHASTIKIVGGVSVGSRERVVVVEVSGRWLVVGVAPGQVSALANVEMSQPVEASIAHLNENSAQNPLAKPAFKQWLNASINKLVEKNK